MDVVKKIFIVERLPVLLIELEVEPEPAKKTGANQKRPGSATLASSADLNRKKKKLCKT